MRVGMLMHTPPVLCRPDTTLREVARLMDERRVGSVVVVDHTGYVTGIVTDRDVAVRGVGAGRSPDCQVEDVMTRDVAAVHPAADVAQAAAVMEERGVRRVPVVDDMGKIHGMLAMDDLVRHLSHEAGTLAAALTDRVARLHPAI